MICLYAPPLQPGASSRSAASSRGAGIQGDRGDARPRPGAALDWRLGSDGRVVTFHGLVADHDELRQIAAAIRSEVEIVAE